MLRSFDYARHTALQQAMRSEADAERLARARAAPGCEQVRAAFLETYRDGGARRRAVCRRRGVGRCATVLALFEIEKALYELRYELNNRPDWVGVPLAGDRRARARADGLKA